MGFFDKLFDDPFKSDSDSPFELGSDLGYEGDFKRWLKGIFDIDDPKEDIPGVEPAPTPIDPGDPIARFVKPNIALALADYRARQARRHGRFDTQITTPGSLMAPNIKRPELADTIG